MAGLFLDRPHILICLISVELRLNIIPSTSAGHFLLIPDAILCLKELTGNVNNLALKTDHSLLLGACFIETHRLVITSVYPEF